MLRAPDSTDGRSVRLVPSKPGQRLYRGLIGAAGERDALFMNCLSREEKRSFDRALSKLTVTARSLIQRERKSA